MTSNEAQAIANLIAACNVAQSRGAFNFADAAQVINAINVIGPQVDAVLNPRKAEVAAPTAAAAALEAPQN